MCKHKIPFIGFIVPEHVWIACFAFECDRGASGIYVKCRAIVGAPCKTLHLACSGGSVHGDYCVFAKAGCIVFVHDTAAAEYCAQAIGLYCKRFMCPMHEIGRYGMPPGHILPFRSIRVVLIIEMPLTIFIKHSIGVIHPSVKRCVMIRWAESLSIVCVE